MRRPSVLLAEAEADTEVVVGCLLDRAGFDVTTVGDIWAVPGIVCAHRPDIILIDVVPPEGAGLQLIRQLRADPGWDRIPIVALTTGNDCVVHAIRAGASAVVRKPDDVGRIADTVSQNL